MTWTRLGWTKLRWPTSAMPGNFAVVGSSSRSLPVSPATHLSLSAPDSASKRSPAVTAGVVRGSAIGADPGAADARMGRLRDLRRKQRLPLRMTMDACAPGAQRQGGRHCIRFAAGARGAARAGGRGNHTSDLRWLDGGMVMDSRYLAMVRRATVMPCSARISAILLSLMGLVVVSHSTSFLMIERIAVAEQVPPSAVVT